MQLPKQLQVEFEDACAALPEFAGFALQLVKASPLSLTNPFSTTKDFQRELGEHACRTLRKEITNWPSIKIRQTDIGPVGVVTSSRNGLLIIYGNQSNTVISSKQIIHPAQAPTDVSQGFHGTAILKDGTVLASNAMTDGVYVLRPNTLQRKVGFMVGFNDDAGGDDGTAVNINLKDGDVYLSIEQEVFHTVSLPELRGQLLAEPGLRYSPKDYWSSLSEVQKADCKAVLNGNAKLAHLVNVLDLSGQWQSL